MSKAARILVLFTFALLLTASVSAESQKNGTITGFIVDTETGDAILGVTVMIDGTTQGAMSQLEGDFTIRNVPPGMYTVRVSSVEYNTIIATDVEVKAGEMTKLDFKMIPKVTQLDNEIKVVGTSLQNTQAHLLKDRQNSESVKDAISGEEIAKSGAGDAAEASAKITGATVVDGSKVFIRGLGDRYGNTQLNGAALPSPDASRGSVRMDLVPTTILDNIVVQKSFTPDKSGDFAGGSVNMTTKDFPEVRTLTFSTSTSYNTITTGETVYTQESGGKDWLGYNDGYYDYPAIIDDDPETWSQVSGINSTRIRVRNDDPADTILVQTRLGVSNGFNKELSPKTRKAPWSQSYSAAFGDQWQMFDRPLGITATMKYGRDFSRQDGEFVLLKNGSVGNYDDKLRFDRDQTKETHNLGGMVGLSYSFHDNHQVSYERVYNRESQTTSTFHIGQYKEKANGDKVRDIGLNFAERRLSSSQFSGKHSLLDNVLKAEWTFSEAATSRGDPDTRFFTDELFFERDSLGNIVDTTYQIDINQFQAPQRLYQELEGHNRNLTLDLTLSPSRTTTVKLGGSYLREERSKRLRQFEYRNTTNWGKEYSGVGVDGDISEYANAMGIDSIKQESGGRYTSYYFQNFFREISEGSWQYDGAMRVDAGYGMLEFQSPLIEQLRFIAGARYEHTDMGVKEWRGSGGAINSDTWLPSLNAVYALTDRMNVRASYGRTLARPTVRELAPGQDNISPNGSKLTPSMVGNPDLRITYIKNYDVRWEWFRRPGEVFAFSLFYKDFTDPIEIAIISSNGNTQPRNTDDATVYGVEFEFRTRLDIIWDELSEVTLGGNATLVHAEMAIDDFELNKIRATYADASDRRDMFGQSPYIVNLDIAYDHFNTGTSIALLYNMFGERLMANSAGTDADVYEMPRHQLDMTFSQRVLGAAKLKFGVKNILDEDEVYKYIDRIPTENQRRGDEEASRYKRGVTYSLGISYDIW